MFVLPFILPTLSNSIEGKVVVIAGVSADEIGSKNSSVIVSNVEYSHYSLLATVEVIFNLGTLGRNEISAAPMSDMFRGGVPWNAHLRFVDFFSPEVLRATAARMSALNAFASISSPS
ncbi:MAG TPA: hypothetical protein VE715_12085 [Blastocatellia bacterium]|nr:hypothetical protein [Blastocatellia bacterium]